VIQEVLTGLLGEIGALPERELGEMLGVADRRSREVTHQVYRN
jgi:hypothetical protein